MPLPSTCSRLPSSPTRSMPVSSMPPSFAPFRSTPAGGWGRRGGRRRRGRLDPQSDPLLPGPPSAVAYREVWWPEEEGEGAAAAGGRGRLSGWRRKGVAWQSEEGEAWQRR